MTANAIVRLYDDLTHQLTELNFSRPVACVYNPLQYAREPHMKYLKRFGVQKREVLLVGMNPGPWGMAQTGVPFGDVTFIQDWMGIEGHVGQPQQVHPKRPVQGFACRRRETSGRRLWGWARDCFGSPKTFFDRFFVANYCPLLFIEESGANRTPDRLPAVEKAKLQTLCDAALVQLAHLLQPRFLVGIGKFAQLRLTECFEHTGMVVGGIIHPSPANPKANQGWALQATRQLRSMGIDL